MHVHVMLIVTVLSLCLMLSGANKLLTSLNFGQFGVQLQVLGSVGYVGYGNLVNSTALIFLNPGWDLWGFISQSRFMINQYNSLKFSQPINPTGPKNDWLCWLYCNSKVYSGDGKYCQFDIEKHEEHFLSKTMFLIQDGRGRTLSELP